MIALEEVHQWPLREKLFVMEVRDDLSQIEEVLTVPEWQQDILSEREAAIAFGSAAFVDWEDAKREIRASVK